MTITQMHGEPVTFSAIVASRLRGVLAERGMNQQDLVRILSVSTSAASKRYRGLMPFPLDEVPVLAAALGTSVAYLMGLTDDRSRPLEEAASAAVRHVGLEPTTRWLRVTPGVVIDLAERRRRHLRLVVDEVSA